jgi:squalene-hopene/tetraprenyl-beta-curcumene cyclase
MPRRLQARIRRATRRALDYLSAANGPDGWVPLWFGNQFASDESNLTYGNARVLSALDGDLAMPAPGHALDLNRAVNWLLQAQSGSGAWSGTAGGQTSIEETALAVEGLAHLLQGGASSIAAQREQIWSAVQRGTTYLVERVEDRTWTSPSPIGFYFAKLWYYERLYPLIFTVGALGQTWRACACAPR